MNKLKFISVVLSSCSCLLSTTLINKENNVEQVVRTAQYNNLIDESILKEEFSFYDVTHSDTKMNLNAIKTFDKSIFDGIDLVSENTNSDTVDVSYSLSYDDNDQSVFLNATIKGEDDIQVIDTLPGIISLNENGDSDIMFALDDEIIWLSEFADIDTVDQTGWFTNLIKKITNTLVDLGSAVIKAFKAIIKPAVRICTNFAILILGSKNAAKIGAFFLNMGQDENGIYHADFNCWQQYFGYTDFYDTVFDATTSMRNAKYPFDIDNDNTYDYIIWAWKGDYLNLGAGAELGIYEKWDYNEKIWKVNKNLAMTMTLSLDYKGKNIIEWTPEEKQWWITAFNYKYLNVDRDGLRAEFTVDFNSEEMYEAFYEKWKVNPNINRISGYKISVSL